MSAPIDNTLPKDQYQHYIPRFILRYFQDAQIRPRNRKERQKNFHKARKTGVDKDTILMYDIAGQSFGSRPIAKVYGVVNMYRDVRSPESVDHLEQGLSRLENDVARTIRDIHAAVESGHYQIKMKRKELETIRKFTYLMHYRRASLVSSYFDENDPENGSIKDWMKTFRQKKNLNSKDDLWLFGLEYILDTPHHKIVAAGEAMQEKYGGPKGVLSMLRTRVDPDIDNYFPLDYTSMANAYFLGIWQAAEGEEFVMGSNSFGLWEGLIDGIPGIHRLFVVSPRIALILRQTFLEAETIKYVKAQASIYSILIDVPMSCAASTYASFKPPSWNSGSEQEAAAQALWKYRQTPAAQEDTFTFKPTRLSREQTYALNHVVLLNISKDGSVTFASPAAMTKTLNYHLHSDHLGARESKYWFRGLSGNLRATPTDPVSSVPVQRSGIDVVLHAIANRTIEFNSTYDRAYRAYHAATDDVTKYSQSSCEIHQMTARAILKMIKILPPLHIAHRRHYFPLLCRDIVKTLPKEESELFFALVGHQVDVLDVGPASGDIMDRIKYEAAIIGFTHWLAENRPLELINRLSFWAKVVL